MAPTEAANMRRWVSLETSVLLLILMSNFSDNDLFRNPRNFDTHLPQKKKKKHAFIWRTSYGLKLSAQVLLLTISNLLNQK